MNTLQLTPQELQDVKILIRLGDSEQLAIQTIIDNRESEMIKKEQLKDFHLYNN